MILIDANILTVRLRLQRPATSAVPRVAQSVPAGGQEHRLGLEQHPQLSPDIDRRARLSPGEEHWQIISKLVRDGQARGPLLMDAHLAALAIEHGAVLCTNDRDFARFPGLRLFNPLAPRAGRRGLSQ